MQKKVQKIFLVLKRTAFEGVGVTYLYHELNSCDRESTCYQTVLRSQILIAEMFSNYIFFQINVKLG